MGGTMKADAKKSAKNQKKLNGEDALQKGVLLYKQRRYADALAFFLALPEDVQVDSTTLAYHIGLCYARLEKWEDALLYLEQVVTSGTELEKVLQCRFLLAVIYAISGRKRLAEFELKKLLETGYETASVYAAIAYVAWEKGDLESALLYYEKSLEADPHNVTSLNGIGYVLASENKDLAKALSYCKRAVDASPRSAACLDSLGWVYFKLGLMNEAKRYLLEAQKYDSKSPVIREHILQMKMKRDVE